MPWLRFKKKKKELISVNVKGTGCGNNGWKITKSIGKKPIDHGIAFFW